MTQGLSLKVLGLLTPCPSPAIQTLSPALLPRPLVHVTSPTEVIGLQRWAGDFPGALPLQETRERILCAVAAGRSPLVLPSSSLSIEWLAQRLAVCLLSQRGFLSGLFSAGRYY